MKNSSETIDDQHAAQQVRDLTWAINSPSLLTNPPTIIKVDPDQIDAEHLASFLNQSSCRRVGRYFERLVLYWLKFIRNVEVVAESLQIREENRTIGEIDVLFRDEQDRLTHWEIAVKFYLYFSGESAIDSHFIGPNAADTFERKIGKLFGHQLPRSKKHFPDVEIRQAFVKGRIFYHSLDAIPHELPRLLSPDHLHGTWIWATQLDQIGQNDEAFYRILHKPFWLSEDRVLTNQTIDSELLSLEALIANLTNHFTSDKRPILVSQLKSDDMTSVETDRIFVVPVGWPRH